MAVRAAMHQAGASALQQLLCFAEPLPERRRIPCGCGQQASYRGLRTKPILTAVGWADLTRPYYLCPHCHTGQFPADVQLDIENTEFSPGVRRMHALVGQSAPFQQAREQMKVLAGLEVTAKSVERTAEAIGADIAEGEQRAIGKAIQLDLPVIVGDPISILYVQMDGTGVPVVKKETEGRKGKTNGQPAHTREAKLGCVFTQTRWDAEGFAIRDPDTTTYTGAIETAEEFGKRIYLEAWNRGWSRAVKKVVIGDGAEWIWNLADQHFPAPFRSSIFTMLVSTYRTLLGSCIPTMLLLRRNGWGFTRNAGSTRAKSKSLSPRCAPSILPIRSLPRCSAPRPTTSKPTRPVCVTPASANNICSSARALSKPVANPSSVHDSNNPVCSGRFSAPNAILTLRCSHLNGRFEDYWEGRRAA